MAFLDTWREPSSKRTYTTTGKEAEPMGSKVDLACWFLQGKIDDTLRGTGSMEDIYYKVTRPMGMSLEDTKTLVKECKKRGYLR